MSTAGFSKARLARMHEVMAGHVERGEVPGIVTLVSRRGEAHVDAIGMKAAGGSEPMRRDTIFRIASLTKPITAVAAMILVEECKVRLDEPVDRLLPELAGRKVLKRFDGPLDDTVPAQRPITVRDLLTFRMGFGVLDGAARRVPDPEGDGRGGNHHRAEVGLAASARGVDQALRHPAADVSAGREMDVPFRLGRAGRADRARLGPAAGDVLARAHLCAAWA